MLGLCFRSFGLAVFVLALAACGPTPDLKDTILCDAFWGKTAYVWLDENANGIWDEGEEPLPSVTVKAVGMGYVLSATSDAQGAATFGVGIPCETGHFDVYAEAPPGYRLTTEPRARSSWTVQSNMQFSSTGQGVIQFGFIRDDSTATPTP